MALHCSVTIHTSGGPQSLWRDAKFKITSLQVPGRRGGSLRLITRRSFIALNSHLHRLEQLGASRKRQLHSFVAFVVVRIQHYGPAFNFSFVLGNTTVAY